MTTEITKMYELWYTNFKYLDDKVFDSLDDAIQYGKSRGFEFSVFLDGDMVGYTEGVSLTWYQTSDNNNYEDRANEAEYYHQFG